MFELINKDEVIGISRVFILECFFLLNSLSTGVGLPPTPPQLERQPPGPAKLISCIRCIGTGKVQHYIFYISLFYYSFTCIMIKNSICFVFLLGDGTKTFFSKSWWQTIFEARRQRFLGVANEN